MLRTHPTPRQTHLLFSRRLCQAALPCLFLTLRLPSCLPRRQQPLLLSLQQVKWPDATLGAAEDCQWLYRKQQPLWP